MVRVNDEAMFVLIFSLNTEL